MRSDRQGEMHGETPAEKSVPRSIGSLRSTVGREVYGRGGDNSLSAAVEDATMRRSNNRMGK